MLNTVTHGQPTDEPNLLIVHGLFGSARNWGVISKRLSDHRQVIAVDMRNHGTSAHFDSHSYADLAGDLAEVISDIGAPLDILGHSMGGKAAMVLALNDPRLINRLIVADIAPVAYNHSQSHLIDAMLGVDLSQVERRADAVAQMPGVEPGLQAFLLQSLDLSEQKWRLNLDILRRDMGLITGFPIASGRFDGPTLFLTGAQSDYVQETAKPEINALFPSAEFGTIPGAGHWLHAENPRAFEAAVREFLGK